MRVPKLVIISATVAVFAFVSVQADAQHRGGGARGGSGGRAAAPRSRASRPVFSSGARIAPRGGSARVPTAGFGASRFGGSRAGVTRIAGARTFGVASRPGGGAGGVGGGGGGG